MTDREELEQLRTEVEGLRATVQNQARIIGQLQRTVRNEGPRIQALQEAKKEAAFYKGLCDTHALNRKGDLAAATDILNRLTILIKRLEGREP